MDIVAPEAPPAQPARSPVFDDDDIFGESSLGIPPSTTVSSNSTQPAKTDVDESSPDESLPDEIAADEPAANEPAADIDVRIDDDLPPLEFDFEEHGDEITLESDSYTEADSMAPSSRSVEDDTIPAFANEDPLTEDPLTEDPLTEDPLTEDPLTEDPLTGDPLTGDPLTEDTAPILANPNQPKHDRVTPDSPDPGYVLDENHEFGLHCPLCDSLIHAKVAQIGKEVKCHDCHTVVIVKAPRRQVREQPVADDDDDDGELRLEEVPLRAAVTPFAIEGDTVEQVRQKAESAPPDERPDDWDYDEVSVAAMKTAAKKYLDQAKASIKADEEKHVSQDLPEKPFSKNLLKFLASPSAILQWLILTAVNDVFLCAFVYRVVYGESSNPAYKVYALFLTVITMCVGILSFFLGSACYLVILQCTAAGHDEIEQWPGWNFTEWAGEAFFVLNATFLSFLPGFLAGMVLSCAGVGSWASMILGTITMVALFPVIELSMLDADSCTTPLTRRVTQSLAVARPVWKQFYLRSLGIVVVASVAGSIVFTASIMLTTMAAAVMVACCMIYFRMLGRLAWVLGEVVPEGDGK